MENSRFKFRVWNKGDETYEETTSFDCIRIDNDGQLRISNYSDASETLEDYTDSYIIEQCTGLKDKNGNLIYEGDVVLAKHSHKSRPGKFIVKWGQGVFHIITAGFWLFDFSPITLETAKKGEDFPESSEIEIIGNIHEQKDNK